MDFEGAFFNTADFELTTTELGKGQFGTVYIANNLKEDKQYAAKIINTDGKFDGFEQMLLLRESLILHKLDHPSIVKFKGINFKSFIDPTKLEPAIITEYLKNGSLKENLNKERHSIADPNWNPTKKYISLLGIANALRYLHKKGVVHRDLKPENILIDSDYYPKVCDFGLSKCFSQSLTNAIDLTMTGQFGTPIYMAPELLSYEEKYTSSVDVYAFAILAYEIVTGNEPYSELGEKISPFAFSKKIIDGYRPKLSDGITQKMKDLLERCWSKEPRERPSFDEIFEKLSSDFTYFEESVDEDEIQEYLERFEDIKIEPPNEKEQKIESIQTELNELKEKVKSYQSSNDALTLALDKMFADEEDINYWQAAVYLEKSSEKGNCYASYILGLLNLYGIKIIRNFDQAKQLFERAETQGLIAGTFMAELCYKKEIHFSINDIYLFQKAASKGSSSALYYLGENYNDPFKENYDCTKAIENYQKSADLGNADSLYRLGYFYYHGRGVEKDYKKSFEYFMKASKYNHKLAIYNLAAIYEEGTGVERDYTKSFEYYRKAAEMGVSDAINNVGQCYFAGQGVEQDYSKAFKYFKQAADAGNATAIYNIGFCYEFGHYVEKDYSKMLEFYIEAGNHDCHAAMYRLGVCYEFGKGVEPDQKKMMEYYEAAAFVGNNDAIQKMNILKKKKKKRKKIRVTSDTDEDKV